MSARPSTGRADEAGVVARRSVLVANDDPLALRALAAVTTSAPDLVVVDHDMRG
jgi:CheY-like chemotaxis protein